MVVRMDAAKTVDRWRQTLAEKRQFAAEKAAARKEIEHLTAELKVLTMKVMQPLFDEQAIRITELVDPSHWEQNGEPIRCHRRQLLQLMPPVRPLLALGRAMTGNTSSTQPYYDVYLTEGKRLLIEPRWHSMPRFRAVAGDRYFRIDKAFDWGGLDDCLVLLEFLMYYGADAE